MICIKLDRDVADDKWASRVGRIEAEGAVDRADEPVGEPRCRPAFPDAQHFSNWRHLIDHSRAGHRTNTNDLAGSGARAEGCGAAVDPAGSGPYYPDLRGWDLLD